MTYIGGNGGGELRILTSEDTCFFEDSGQYHKVGVAGRFSLFVANNNLGTHWIVTRDEEIVYRNYYKRPSVKLLRQRESEYRLAFTQWGNEPKQPFSAAVPEGTPTTWKRVDNPCADFYGRKGY